jgi:1-phosphofructokinase family hexose kinase
VLVGREGTRVIVCVSANPALDVCLRVPRLAAGAVQRADGVRRLAGGKAAHVALAARALGAPVVLLGWFGGATGQRCQQQLAELGLPTLAVPTRCETRQNLEIVDDEGRSTEVLEPGGPVGRQEVELLVNACTRIVDRLGRGNAIVLSGSLPTGAPVDLFAEMVAIARRHEVATFVDTSGAALDAAIGAGPDWIKPNHDEAGELLGRAVVDTRSALAAARALRAKGAARVVLSRGRHGLVAVDEASAFEGSAPPVEATSSVGCGDATVAGLAVATLRGAPMMDVLRLAIACGNANCRAMWPGRLSPELVEQALASTEVSELRGGLE